MLRSQKHIRNLHACLICVALIWPVNAGAKFEPISLGGLVNGSEQIMYVERVSNPPRETYADQTEPVVIYRTLTVLKGEQKEFVALCNRVYNAEWYDLEKLEEPLVIFAFKHEGCYATGTGVVSVVRVRDGRADTSLIDGEPKEQGIKEFMQKIQSRLNSQPSIKATESMSAKNFLYKERKATTKVQMELVESQSIKDKDGELQSFGKFKVTNNGAAPIILPGRAGREGFEILNLDIATLIELGPDGWEWHDLHTMQALARPDKLTIAPGLSADVLINTTGWPRSTRRKDKEADKYLSRYRILLQNLPNHVNILSEPFLIRASRWVSIKSQN